MLLFYYISISWYNRKALARSIHYFLRQHKQYYWYVCDCQPLYIVLLPFISSGHCYKTITSSIQIVQNTTLQIVSKAYWLFKSYGIHSKSNFTLFLFSNKDGKYQNHAHGGVKERETVVWERDRRGEKRREEPSEVQLNLWRWSNMFFLKRELTRALFLFFSCSVMYNSMQLFALWHNYIHSFHPCIRYNGSGHSMLLSGFVLKSNQSAICYPDCWTEKVPAYCFKL